MELLGSCRPISLSLMAAELAPPFGHPTAAAHRQLGSFPLHFHPPSSVRVPALSPPTTLTTLLFLHSAFPHVD